MSHAFQTVLWMLLQFFAPRHNAQIRFLKAQIEILRRRLPGERIVPPRRRRPNCCGSARSSAGRMGPSWR